MPAPALSRTVRDLLGKPHPHLSYNLVKPLQSWAMACSLGLAPKLTGPEGHLGISLPSSRLGAVSAVRACLRALGPDPGSDQLSPKGQPQAPQGGVLCHLCSGTA